MRCSRAFLGALLGAALGGLAGAPASPRASCGLFGAAGLAGPDRQGFPRRSGRVSKAISKRRRAVYLAASAILPPRTRRPPAADACSGGANPAQSSGIGTGLGQAALMAVKTDQAYANEIQQAIAIADASRGVQTAAAPIANGGSDQPQIGNAIVTKDRVEGVTERGAQALIQRQCDLFERTGEDRRRRRARNCCLPTAPM